MRLVDRDQASWQNRAHFLGIAAGTMRDILVDRARRAGAQKRGVSPDERWALATLERRDADLMMAEGFR